MSRIEEENESLLIQIKKISTSSKSKIESTVKGKGTAPPIAEKTDASELKLQLELNEQESKILQRKVEELEKANNNLAKELQTSEEKLEALKREDSQPVTKSKVNLITSKVIQGLP